MSLKICFIVCCLWLLQMQVSALIEVGTSTSTNNSKEILHQIDKSNITITNNNNNNNTSSDANASNNIPTNITNYQVKTTNASHLKEVQLQETAMLAESNNKQNTNSSALAATNSNSTNVGKTLRRKITPTSNAEYEQTVKEESDNAQIKSNNTNGTVAATPTIKMNATAQTGGRMVAENVYLNVSSAAVSGITGNNNNNQTNTVNGTVAINTKTALNQTNVMHQNATQNSAVKADITKTIAATANAKRTAINGTTTSTTKSTSTTTTTPKPKKPAVTYGVEDFPNLEDNVATKTSQQQKQTATQKDHNSSIFPTEETPETEPIREAPNAQPSQELNSRHLRHFDTIVPIITVICTIPLAIGVLFVFYRRFRDFWSTRHYRRMDFLVDGMYND